MAKCLCGCGNSTSKSRYLYIRSHKPFTHIYPEKTIQTDNGCIEWTGKRLPKGYGLTHVHGKPIYAHRATMLYIVGIDPKDKLVCHTCDNPPCVNPEHLYVGDHKDNNGDTARRGRNLKTDGTHVRASLSREDVMSILLSDNSYADIATKYGVSASLIGQIKRHVIYAHVIDEILLMVAQEPDPRMVSGMGICETDWSHDPTPIYTSPPGSYNYATKTPDGYV